MFYRKLNRFLPVVSALRPGHLAVLVCAFSNTNSEVHSVKVSDSHHLTTPKKMRIDTPDHINIDVSDGLLLYYDRFSYYSQKVVLTLYEKNLQFESKIINLGKSEQYQSSFLFLNPRAEVPVLQDTGKIITDSARIIDYLEDNYHNADIPKLLPMDQGPEIRQKVTNFRHLLQKAPAGNLTTGAVIHSHFLKNPKIPFLAPIRKALANAEKDGASQLRDLAEKNPQYKEVLLAKAATREQNYEKMCDEKKFAELLDQIHAILDEVENELGSHIHEKWDWWLCSDRFTIADVELTVLLIRISQLGLGHLFWEDGKRPHIELYYQRVQLRDSYKKTVPGALVLLQTVIGQKPLVIGIVTALAVIIGGAVLAATL